MELEASDATRDGRPDAPAQRIPIEADFLYAYSTTPGQLIRSGRRCHFLTPERRHHVDCIIQAELIGETPCLDKCQRVVQMSKFSRHKFASRVDG